MAGLTITQADIERGKRNEERNEAMNMMNSAQKANSKEFNKGYDGIQWDDKPKPFVKPLPQWYAYLHVFGNIVVKRYREGLQAGDIDEAVESPNVVKVVGPFGAKDRNDAVKQARERLDAA